ncbi:MAG TPA: hypothetical protein VJ865_12660 [Gemmatimonadaceae bacterium]|nr:hypothetical protein [Gemmatimonadaceae bacterium]
MSTHESVYRFLLRAYPHEFRSAYGREMEQLFRDQRRNSAESTARLWVETVWDLVRSAPAMRMEAARARWNEDIHIKEKKMKTIANLATLIGVILASSAFIEGWAGGIGNRDALSLTAGTLGFVAGALLFAAGIGLLRNSRRAHVRAQGAAITCLATFALVAVAAPRMSLFTSVLGIGFPIALLFFLRWTRGRGSAPTVAAVVFALSFGLPLRSSAQAAPLESTIASAEAKDLPLTAIQRQRYIGKYETELPESNGEKIALRVFEENGVLRLWVGNPNESRRLIYQGDNIFLLENTPGFVLTFVLVHDVAMKFTVHKPEGDLLAVRIS